MLRYTTDRATPGLVTLYDIWPGNGAGQFLQPRSPHGAYQLTQCMYFPAMKWRSAQISKINFA